MSTETGAIETPRAVRALVALSVLAVAAATTLSSAFPCRASPGTVVLPEGCELREEPHGDSALVGLLREGPYPSIASSGEWVQVIAGERLGWVRCRGAGPAAGVAEAGSEARPDPEDLLSGSPQRLPAGSFLLITDVGGDRWRKLFEHLSSKVDAAYGRRYGVEIPVALEADRVVIFAREADYLAYAASEEKLDGVVTAGHTKEGLAALYLGRRTRSEIGATLVHELTHLLNRRVFGRELPPWLEEGLAEDLAMTLIDERGQLARAARGGRTVFFGERLEIFGNLALLERLIRSLDDGSLPPAAELMDLDAGAFSASADRDLLYLVYGCRILHLLSGEGERAAALRSFLASAAGGGETEFGALAAALGAEPDSLDRDFRVWLRRLAERLRLPLATD